jgi:RNA polymerase sigma factor (sigma-70 family)
MTTNDDAFEQFLIHCEPDVSSSAERHRRLRAKLIRFFAARRCEDAEGLADETIGRLVTILYSGQHIDNPPGYALGSARNVYREHIRKTSRLSQLDEDSERSIDEQQAAVELDSFDDGCAKLCFQKLPDDKRLLLEQYYSDEGSREDLAKQAGLSLAGLRTKIHRLKGELKKCYRECMQGQLGLRRN